ncbi:MAG: metal-dependent transcriptional regulator [Acholeplasmatales bacterium]|nr:MAG: metal-dependent transcriptional regulator [Acholeplasmatales bacterium]
MNKAEEDYVKMIYEMAVLTGEPYVKTADLAEQFGYSVQSVNEMIKKLHQKELVDFRPYKGVCLTEGGRREALRMIRAHRLWEVFLSERLGLAWEALHEEAEMLEHATSEAVLERLYDYLGRPAVCNHGNPIPDAEGNIARPASRPLYETHAGDCFRILRVQDYKPLLAYLSQRNIKLHDVLTVHDKDHFGGILTVEHLGLKHAFAKHIAQMVYGEVLSSTRLKK